MRFQTAPLLRGRRGLAVKRWKRRCPCERGQEDNWRCRASPTHKRCLQRLCRATVALRALAPTADAVAAPPLLHRHLFSGYAFVNPHSITEQLTTKTNASQKKGRRRRPSRFSPIHTSSQRLRVNPTKPMSATATPKGFKSLTVKGWCKGSTTAQLWLSRFSIFWTMAGSPTAPMMRSTTCPFLKNSKVGMLMTW